ncbi:hypothetical protein KKG38_04065, partial [Patescibacteria group bacterium]|nr:hypothetical protein [Patescibacteria group bacterium]
MDKEINNQKLYLKLKELTKIALRLYKKNPFEKESLDFLFEFEKVDKRIKKQSLFNICLQIMKNDEKIEFLEGKNIGISNFKFSINKERCILVFLRIVYNQNNTYIEDIFNESYVKFEELFYSNDFVYLDSSNLYNFDYDGEEIKLNDELVIKKKIKKTHIKEDFDFHRIRMEFAKSDFIIERKQILPKLLKNKEKIELIETTEFFDFIVYALRLLKHSAVYRSDSIYFQLKTFSTGPKGFRQGKNHQDIISGKKCFINEEDINELSSIFQYIISEEKESRFSLALRRLSMGMSRKNFDDKIIDYIIGFEALYLPESKAELSFKIALRVAFLLSDIENREENYLFLKKMYTYRSNIVHGEKQELKNDDILKLENLLRQSLMLWMKDENIFSKKELDR